MLNKCKVQFPPEIKNERRMSTISILVNIVLEVTASVKRKEKQIKGIGTEKEEKNTALIDKIT